MSLNPAKTLTKPIRFRSAIVAELLVLYVGVTFIIFFYLVIPSFAVGTTGQMFYVDSTLYVNFANSLREGFRNPWVLASLAHFPNTLWTPVFISYVLPDPLYVMLLNYGAFVVSVLLLSRSYRISLLVFLPLLLMNPTSTTSILCVNKEVLDLLAISMFLYARVRRNRWVLFLALGLAFLNRWEVCAVMITFLAFNSRVNPLRQHRLTMLILLVLCLSIVMPVFAGKMLAGRFEEAQSGNIIVVLDHLQMHYLYAIAIIPKVAENLFGEIVSRVQWESGSSGAYIIIFNNVSTAILLWIAARKKLLTLQNDLVYLSAIGAVIVAQALVIQPRYFYFLYAVICLQVARRRSDQTESCSWQRKAGQAAPVSAVATIQGAAS